MVILMVLYLLLPHLIWIKQRVVGWAMCHALGILVYVLFVHGGCGGVGGATGEERCRELLEEGGYLWCGGCVGVY